MPPGFLISDILHSLCINLSKRKGGSFCMLYILFILCSSLLFYLYIFFTCLFLYLLYLFIFTSSFFIHAFLELFIVLRYFEIITLYYKNLMFLSIFSKYSKICHNCSQNIHFFYKLYTYLNYIIKSYYY